MKGIRKRGNKWMVDVTVGGVRKTTTCATEEQAKLRHAELTAALLRGDISDVDSSKPSGWTLTRAYETTVLTRWKGTKSEVSSSRNGKLIKDFFGKDTKLDEIDTPWLDAFVQHCVAIGNSGGTINRKLAALSAMFSTAQERGGVRGKPKFPRQPEGKARMMFISREEEAAMLKTLASWGQDDLSDAIVVLIDTGFRLSELWGLEWADVDLTNRQITSWLNKRTDDPRTIPMTARVAEIMLKRHASPLSKPFPYNNQWIRGRWDRLRNYMGRMEDTQFVPHILRHTCASRLVQKDVSLPVVKQWMGHKSLQVTLRYSHLNPGQLQSAAAALEL